MLAEIWPFRSATTRAAQAPLALRETALGLELTAEVPALARDKVRVSINGRRLSIALPGLRERNGGAGVFPVKDAGTTRSITLPFAPDPKDISGSVRNGRLKLSISRPVAGSSDRAMHPIRTQTRGA